MSNLMKIEQWGKAAKRLESLGHTMVRQEGVIPAFFQRGEEFPLYLFCPILDNRYEYKVIPEGGMAFVDFIPSRPVVYYNESMTSDFGRRQDRPWFPRKLWNAPILYGYREIAEHVGISQQHAVLLASLKKIKPSATIGRRKVFTARDILAWLENRRKAGRPTKSTASKERA